MPHRARSRRAGTQQPQPCASLPRVAQPLPAIYRILSESRSWARELTPAELIERVTHEINAVPTLRVEYFEIVDTDSLQPIASWSDSPAPHGCITVYCGERRVRLIDNIAYQ